MANWDQATKPPPGMKEVITDWSIEYHRARGSVRSAIKVSIPPRAHPLALAWLRTLLLTPRARREHFAMVDSVFPERPVLAAPWRIIDPYGMDAATDPDTALPKRALDLAYAGLGQMTPDEIVFLLLDEETLTNFSLLVRDLMPDWWLDALSEEGASVVSEPLIASGVEAEELESDVGDEEYGELMSTSDLFAGTAVRAPDETQTQWTGPTVWEITLSDASRERIAILAFGDATVKFTLRLHRLGDGRAELEMTPPPLKADVTLPAKFGTGACCMFIVAVPAEAKIPGIASTEIRRSTRSKPCASLTNEAFAISGGELRSENGTDTLVFR